MWNNQKLLQVWQEPPEMIIRELSEKIAFQGR